MISNSGTTSLGLYDFKRQIDAFGGVDYFRPTLAGGYLPNARVMLNNGEIVQNVTNGNLTNDPNVDMTGWVNPKAIQDEINQTLQAEMPYSTYSFSNVQDAVDDSPLGNTIHLQLKEYNESIDLNKNNLVGQGYGTVLKVASNSYGIKSLQTSAWDRMKVSNVAFLGESLVGTVGFEFDPSNPLAGRRNLEYCTFKNLDVGIYKPTGNIGNKYTSCSFTGNNYGYRAKSATTMVMHSGCDTFDDCQFDGTNTWAIDLTNTTDGFGQFAIENSIFQFSGGGGVRLDLGNIIPVCPPVIRNTWFESVATSTSVDRDGVAETPREIKLINTPMCIIEGCYLTNVELINSTAIAKHCRIDNATTFPQFYIDNNSQFIVEDLYANGFVPPTIQVKSIAKQARELPSALTMRGYDISGITKRPPNAFSAIGLPYSGTVGVTTWSIVGTETRTASCVVDDGITGTCAELELQAGIINVIGNTTLTAGKWAVWGVSLKPVYGTGVAGIFKFKNVGYDIGDLYVSEGSWSHNFGVAKVGTGGSVACWLDPSASGGKMRISNYFVIEFNTEKEAIAFANSRLAVDTD